MVSIFVSETGEVNFTRKPELLALFEGERKEIVRMTDILHHSDLDRYYIKFLTGPFAGRNLDTYVYSYVSTGGPRVTRRGPHRIQDEPPVNHLDIHMAGPTDIYKVLMTETYEEAVALEVWFVDHMRRLGFSPVA